jgi:pimeloyl-ACP methyl ester carboxylesterase
MLLARPRAQPHVRIQGDGPPVVCLHCNAGSSGQWRGLMERLAPRYRVLAPDLYGAGRSPDWHSHTVIRLQDELDLIEPLLAAAGEPVVLVGHSYGAAVALVAALRRPRLVRALALYEPTLFALLDDESAPPDAADGIRNACADAAQALDRHDTAAAARAFFDYWSGAGTWDAMREEPQRALAASIVHVRRWEHALFSARVTARELRALHIPVLCMTGSRTTASALGVSCVLARHLPNLRRLDFDGLGHMGPVTHAGQVDAAIADFLHQLDQPLHS